MGGCGWGQIQSQGWRSTKFQRSSNIQIPKMTLAVRLLSLDVGKPGRSFAALRLWSLVLGTWNLNWRLIANFRRGRLNQLPHIAEVFFGRENVTESNPHDGAPVQLGLGKVCPAGSIDFFHDSAVHRVAPG